VEQVISATKSYLPLFLHYAIIIFLQMFLVFLYQLIYGFQNKQKKMMTITSSYWWKTGNANYIQGELYVPIF